MYCWVSAVKKSLFLRVFSAIFPLPLHAFLHVSPTLPHPFLNIPTLHKNLGFIQKRAITSTIFQKGEEKGGGRGGGKEGIIYKFDSSLINSTLCFLLLTR